MLRIFCRMKTRVTLDTAMPPRMNDDQPDQAEVVLGTLEVAADLILGRPVRPRVDELVFRSGARRNQRLDASSAPATCSGVRPGCRTRASPVDGRSS
jgi:hypothetical protein